jgi:hypothetical protein
MVLFLPMFRGHGLGSPALGLRGHDIFWSGVVPTAGAEIGDEKEPPVAVSR